LDAKQLNQVIPFFRFNTESWVYQQGLWLPHKVVAKFTGNQYGKTAGEAIQYIRRILGTHPIPNRNVLFFECPSTDKEWERKDHPWFLHDFGDGQRVPLYQRGEYSPYSFPKDGKCEVCGATLRVHNRKSRVFRFCSETLPGEKANVEGEEGASAEVKNTIYPAFKEWLPRFLIKRDITARQPAMILKDPNAGRKFGKIFWPGVDIVVEFVSYSQRVQAAAGVQRISIWEDEEAPIDFHEEQMPRLLAEHGDLRISLTPANRMSWTFDEIFERAGFYLRSQAIVDFYKSLGDKTYKIEHVDDQVDVAVVQAATDDNPTMSKKQIEKTYFYDDPDTVATRRYGIFRQSTGRVFNDFLYKVHVVTAKDHFPGGFDLCTLQEGRAHQVAEMSGLEKYTLNMIDPRADINQSNTGSSALEDLNDEFFKLRRQGIGTGGYWETYDTKGLVGRNDIRTRLSNSVRCKIPFHNTINDGNNTILLPTIWILRSCPETAKSLRQWRYEEWGTGGQLRDKKEQPAQKFSHFCTALEGLLKDRRFRPRMMSAVKYMKHKRPQYFKNRG
jgi:hypothetical protein